MAEEVALYEATLVEAGGDHSDKVEVKIGIEIPVSTADMRALREEDEHDAQSFNKVLSRLVGGCRCQVIESRSWKCGLCRDAPAVQIIGSSISYVPPRGREPRRIIDEAIHPICDDSACVRRATHIMKRAEKEHRKEAKSRDDAVYVYTCDHCGREESDGGLKMLRRSRCRISWYCGASCQRAHWERHKPVCPKIQKRENKK